MLEKRLALTTVFLTLGLMLMGSIVHSTDSGLACPDWPLCFGSAFPAYKNGVAYEHTHRVLGFLVASFTAILFLVIRKKYGPSSMPRKLAGWACIVVLFQATLGGMTVIFRLPTIVSTAHLGTSMIFISILFMLWLRLVQWQKFQENPKNLPVRKRPLYPQ